MVIPMRVLYIKVPKIHANDILAKIKSIGLLEPYPVKKDVEYVYFPVKGSFEKFETLFFDVDQNTKYKGTFHDWLNLPENVKKNIPHSFDIVGDIAIIKLDKGQYHYAEEIKKSIMEKVHAVKHVAIDEGVKGEYRTRSLKFIGEDYTGETLHRENGITLKMDISKCYFSPRLSQERMRVMNRVKDNEIIIDMFSGIGPFTILIAKFKKVKKIYAIDINQIAIKYLMENMKINKIDVPVYPIPMDANEAMSFIEPGDRYIMNNPTMAIQFLPLVNKHSRKSSQVHFYILSTEEHLEEVKKSIETEYSFSILESHVVHPYSPSKNIYGLILEKY
ncbi:MAG: class I SAM-dependent methyltransferase [Thermoplasmata archaeon]